MNDFLFVFRLRKCQLDGQPHNDVIVADNFVVISRNLLSITEVINFREATHIATHMTINLEIIKS